MFELPHLFNTCHRIDTVPVGPIVVEGRIRT